MAAPAAAAGTTTTTTPLGYPFTHAQWKELQTQAMIYKYMVASLPVPPDLLFPIIRSLSQSHHSTHNHHHPYYSFGGGGLTLGYGVRTDGEPGRCKRTDGKKWRCSREVAPHQKYCDRHLHRGRPRSRKLVEAQANGNTPGSGTFGNTNATKKTRGNIAGFPASVATGSVSFPGGGAAALAPRDDGVPLIFPGDDDNSSFLTLEPSYKESRDVDWLMIGDPSSYNSFAASSYMEPTDYTKGQSNHSFFGSDPLALSSLTLSMAGADTGEMGSRLGDSSSWVPLAPGGGPLAEALGHGMTTTHSSNPSSPSIAGNGNDEMSSSPRMAASPFARSEFTVQWFSPPNNLASFAN